MKSIKNKIYFVDKNKTNLSADMNNNNDYNDNNNSNNDNNNNNNGNNVNNNDGNNNGNDNGNDNGNNEGNVDIGSTTACWTSLAVPALVLLFGLLMTFYMMGSNVHIALKLAGIAIAVLAALSGFGQAMLCARKQTALGWGLGGATLAVVVGGAMLLFAWLQNRTK